MTSEAGSGTDFKKATKIHEFYFYRENFKLSSNVSVSVTFNEPIFAKENYNKITTVAEFLITKYPILRCNIFKTNDKEADSFIIKPIDLDFITKHFNQFIIRNHDTIENTQLFENPSNSISDETYLESIGNYFFEHNDSENILWRLLIIDDYKVTFLYDHVLLDGMSGFNFIKEFQQAYDELIGSKELIAEKYHNSLQEYIFSSFEILNIHKIRFSTILRKVFLILIVGKSKIVQRIIRYFLGSDFIPAELSLLNDSFSEKPVIKDNLNTGIISINISNDELSKLLSACKKYNLKTSVWMLSALQLTLNDHLIATGNEDKKLACTVPINIREYIRKKSMMSPIHDNDLKFGLFIGYQVLDFHPLSQAKNINRIPIDVINHSNILRNDIHNSFIDTRENMGLLNNIGSFHNFFNQKSKNLKKSHFSECSSLGMYKNKESKLKVEDMYFTSGNSLLGSSVSIYTVSSQIGGCNLSFSMDKDKKFEVESLIKKNYVTNLLSITEENYN